MRILGLNATSSHCAAAVVDGTVVLAQKTVPVRVGQPAVLPGIVQSVLTKAGVRPADIDLIAVITGPGSFTGIRTAIAFAHGLALPHRKPVAGVSVGEAHVVALRHIGREVWTVTSSGRSTELEGGRIFLERRDGVSVSALGGLPRPEAPVAISGNAAVLVAARLAAQGHDVMLTDLRDVDPCHVAWAAQAQWSEGGGVRLPRPLYIDSPAAKLPAGGLRPTPSP
jgi:tRNA threonylcarbamoyladenosine biosynthesis protein TsaB